MNKKQLFEDICDKYGEWLEMSEDRTTMLVDILMGMVIKEKELNEHYKKRLDHVCASSTK